MHHHPFLTLLICGVVLFFLLPSVLSGFNEDLQADRNEEEEQLALKDDYVFNKDGND